MFERLFRSSAARRRGAVGMGLGLAIVARVVRAMGGRMEVWSEESRGSRFTVRLPLRTGPLEAE